MADVHLAMALSASATSSRPYRRTLRRRAYEIGGGRDSLVAASSLEEWVQRLKELKKPLLVPGSWWVNEQQKTAKFKCKIVDVERAKGRYAFSIVCVDDQGHRTDANDPYIMHWGDLQRYVLFLGYMLAQCPNAFEIATFRAKIAALISMVKAKLFYYWKRLNIPNSKYVKCAYKQVLGVDRNFTSVLGVLE